ncbi:uncharacterized protein LOC106514290 isoform X2 [Austrofundulus limnaeus]|uniref:Uncharacterized protein LOC106514290 isoform X2 n=1 Tax=Austrofundulus limnaeus TaxID=52670 RepID=A0A2I4ATW5_AUSLI|nr:PREDICTED: uncharacterized protein LOC106514290 isoform X2 [Austrofundulus limnaeus]
MLLLTHLIELQEVQASFLLQELLDRNTQGVQVLQRKYEAELEAQRFTNLLHLLVSDDPLTPGFMTENTHKDLIGPESSSLREILSDGSAAAPTADSIDRTSREQKEVQTANDSAKQEICSGCGAVMEDLPYLEILRAPDTRGEEDEASETESHQSYEKQRSLITLAWSKPSEDDKAETAGGETEQNRDDSTTQVQSTQCGKTVQETDREDMNPTLLQNGSSDHQYSPTEQLNLKKTPKTKRSEGGEAASESDLQTDATEVENLQHLQPNVLDDLCSGTSDPTAREKKMCPTESTLVELRGPEHSGHEDQTRSQESTMEFSLPERNQTREPSPMEKERHPVSAMDRERTMQNLVDMQKKFEEKHQRDKERQLLKVQERLSIIQSKKAEEDLLGLKHTDRLRHLTQDLPMEDKNQQKTVVKERLEQLRRERSYIMQSKRDRNTAVFKELLAPVHLHISETEDGTN